MKKIPVFLCFLFLAAALPPGEAPADKEGNRPLFIAYSIPRDYGFFLGDLVEVHYHIHMASDQFLNEASLVDQKATDDFEIHSMRTEKRTGGAKTIYHLRVLYQLFSAPEIPQFLEIPQRKFLYGGRTNRSAFSSPLPSIPVMVSPIASNGAQFKPPILGVWISSYPVLLRRIGIAIVLSGLFFWVFLMRKTPRETNLFRIVSRKLSRQTDALAGLVLFRTSLNEKAGKAIFPRNLEEFFRAFPQAGAHRKEIEKLVSISEEVIFNPQKGPTTEELISRIAALTRKLSRAERWA